MVFFSTYELYQQGRSQVVAWLGKTAAECGYEFSSADTSEPDEKVEKKGSKSNRNSLTKSSSQVTKCTVSVRQLRVLARVISQRFQQVSDFKALPSIVEVLKDVIVKRKQWEKVFERPGLPLGSHLHYTYFVTVLEDVCQILGGVLSALQLDKGQTSVVPATGEKSTSEMAISNPFAVLAIEESTDQDGATDDEDTTPRPARSPSHSRPPTITYELEDEVEDFEEDFEIHFMNYCFFKDFLEVRNFIGQSWVEYKSGMLDLAAVAVTTNNALEMLQRAEKALLESFPKEDDFASYEQVGEDLYMYIAFLRGVDPDFVHKKGDVINMDLQSIADFTCFSVFLILAAFLQIVEVKPDFLTTSPVFWQNGLTGHPVSWRDKFNQDKIVLSQLLPEICILKEVKVKIPVVDELSRGLVDMMWTDQIPLWLVLGCQIYLDIHHTLFTGIEYNAHKELQTFGLHVSKTVQDYLDFSKGMSVETWPEQNDTFLRMIKLEADLWVNQDYFAAYQKKLFKSVNLPKSTTRPYSLLSRHPLLCGLILFRLNLRLQEAGIALVTAWGSLPSVLHLYNAVKQESSGDGFPLWEDAENVIQIQGKERVFVGDFPKNSQEYLKRFCLAMGYNASTFGQNRRDQGPRASKHGPRETIITSTMADVFRGQICENETRSDVTFHKIEKVLTTSSPEKKIGTDSNGNPRPFTSVSFLSSLQARIQSEILALNINYFALHMRCYNLLRDIKVQLDPEIRKYVGPEYVEEENHLPFLVGDLFRTATVGETLKLGKDTKSALLVKAGEIVKELVQREGAQEVERVRIVCRGFDWLEKCLSWI